MSGVEWVHLASWGSAAILLPMLLVSLYNLRTAPRLERAGAPHRRPLVSLLVPARNESANLRDHLPSLLGTDYSPLEVIVLDDGSEDDTAALVQDAAARSGGRLRLLRGEPLPAGWLGKSWACEQLAAAAGGEVLIFCDADVAPAPPAVAQTVALLEAGADAATAIPRQRLDGWWAAAVIPLVVQLPVSAMLPLALVRQLASPSLSMANGQWLAFHRAAYRAVGGHRAVRGEIVEDVALGRLVKQCGLRLVPAVAAHSLEVRMYREARAMWSGLGRTIYPLSGGHPARLALAFALFIVAAVLPWLLLFIHPPAAALPLATLLAIRLAGAAIFRHGAASALLHPLGSALLLLLAIDSLVRGLRGSVRWKGRLLARQPAA